MTSGQIVAAYGPSVVRITTRAPYASAGKLLWRTVTSSGVIVSKDGLIYTSGQPLMNRTFSSWWPTHVTVECFGDQGQYSEVDGMFLGGDPQCDLGVVKIDGEGRQLRPVSLGDSESVSEGDQVVTLSRQSTFLAWDTGEVDDVLTSMLDAPEEQETIVAMRTSAEFKQSPAGGALIDSQGRLIGVMGDFYWTEDAPGYTGDSVAVAIGLFRQAVPQTMQQDTSPWLGIGYQVVTPSVAEALGLGGVRGLLVEFVTPDSPAEKAGIRGGGTCKEVDAGLCVVGGDILLAIDGVSLSEIDALAPILDEIGTGRTVPVQLLRGGRQITVQVRLVPNPRKI
jgi:S1-C subfamily serine protease